ncbi:hypothetical protein BOS5A_80080 [Bosea sp. EC-HK365B]|nr:hypothetical protein BOS5A_80080 [Bosea sp. EC-HK365B]VXC64976.1 hypothetical protein BOSE127_30180 [Bosea sp. 127]
MRRPLPVQDARPISTRPRTKTTLTSAIRSWIVRRDAAERDCSVDNAMALTPVEIGREHGKTGLMFR